MTAPVNRPLSELKPHPINATLYEPFTEDLGSFKQMVESVQENGLLQPLIVRPDGTILSGHRRFAVITHLGWTSAPCIDGPEGDDRTLLIEYNRYRHKSVSEIMREATMIEAIIAEKAALARSRAGWPRDCPLPESEKTGKVRDTVSASVGMKPRTFAKLRTVYEVAKENENAKAHLAKIDAGEMSIDAAYKACRSLIDPVETTTGVPEFIRYFNSMQFSENDPRFGIPHPGRIPGQIAGNIIWYFTEPGDLVVDPMAGWGSTLDVALHLGRLCQAYDVKPMRPDIVPHDISKGFPDEAKDCDLIFMDPPYWNMKDEGYCDASSSRLDLDGFCSWYNDLLCNASRTVRIGGFVAVTIMGQYFRLPDDYPHGYIDWPFIAYDFMRSAGMAPWARVGITHPPSLYGGFDVEKSKADKYLLPNLADVIIMRRTK